LLLRITKQINTNLYATKRGKRYQKTEILVQVSILGSGCMFVFLDESGRLDSRDDINRPTISAVLIPESSLNEATRELLNLKKDLCPENVNPEEFELKSSKVLRPSAGNWKIELAISRAFTNFLYKHIKGQMFLKRIVPFPLFGNSSLICGIELADMIAGCLSCQADLYESEAKNKMLLSRFTRYKEEIEKVQAEMPADTGNYAIQYSWTHWEKGSPWLQQLEIFTPNSGYKYHKTF